MPLLLYPVLLVADPPIDLPAELPTKPTPIPLKLVFIGFMLLLELLPNPMVPMLTDEPEEVFIAALPPIVFTALVGFKGASRPRKSLLIEA